MRMSLVSLGLGLVIAVGLAACNSAPIAVHGKPSSFAPTDAAGIVEADIATLSARMERGEITSVKLCAAYVRRIAAIDDGGPRLNAVIELNPKLAEEAAERDAERAAGHVRGPLHGIPVLLKDNIDATPMVNSAGSLALAEHRPKRDAPLVAALREAGAVILGKTNLSEWANFRSTRSTSGWSARGGQTRNPYVLDRNPCGSSSGTGAAIAASLATVGVGTETDGSILCPSAVNGLVGMKPTVGLIGRSGIIPISYSQDTAGPMTRSVADAAVLLGAMAATSDAEDPATRDTAKHRLTDYTTALRPEALKGTRIGVLRKKMGYQPQVDVATERAIATLRAAGATVVDAQIPTEGQWRDAELTVLLYEFKHGLARYLSRSGAPVKNLAELIAFNQENAEVEMPFFAQELFDKAQLKGPPSDKAYRLAANKARLLAGPRGIDATLRKHKLDALVAPTTSPAWMTDPLNGDHFTGAGYSVAAVAGYPSLTVPMGDADGLPLGLTFLGPRWSEARLLGYGYAFEQLAQERKPPMFRPTLAP
ncbi:MAG TPA: amidase [Lysobacter sp.]